MQKKDAVIYHNESSYSAFPEVIRRKNGETLVYFGEIPLDTLQGHGAAWAHYAYQVQLRCFSSKDGGNTWLPSTTEPSPYAAFGGYIARLASGHWLASGYRYKFAWAEEQLADFGPKCSLPGGLWAGETRAYVLRSQDEGTTWEKQPTWLDKPSVYPFAELVELPNGTFLMPAYGRPRGETADSSFLMKSNDGGHSWQHFSTIAADPNAKIQYHEPCCLHLGDRRLLAILRTAGAAGYLYQALSQDDGATWEQPTNTGIWGHPAHLLRLKGGDLLCVYGYRRDPFGIRACLSHDEGKTWDMANEMVLRDDGGGWDLGYPRCVLLDDGSILAIYYFNHGTDCSFIAGTIFEA